jgi:DNA-binding CsgD family transcriptional regulator
MCTNTSQFSGREKEVTGLLLQGKSNKQIALALGISASTVEYHLKNIYNLTLEFSDQRKTGISQRNAP